YIINNKITVLKIKFIYFRTEFSKLYLPEGLCIIVTIIYVEIGQLNSVESQLHGLALIQRIYLLLHFFCHFFQQILLQAEPEPVHYNVVYGVGIILKVKSAYSCIKGLEIHFHIVARLQIFKADADIIKFYPVQ